MTVHTMPLPAAAAIFVILTIINGILYACAAALKAVPEAEIRMKADKGIRRDQRILRLLEDPARAVYTQRAVLVITVFFTTLFAAVPLYRAIAEATAGSVYLSVLLWVLLLFVLLLFFLSFGMVIPSRAAMQLPVRTLSRYGTFCAAMCFLMAPLTYAAAGISNTCIRLIGMDPLKEEPDVTAHEIISMVGEANEQGLIKENEAEMIRNIIMFDEKTVREVMTPRNQIAAIDCSEKLSDAICKMLEENRTRYPVYREDADDVIGILHFRDSILEMRDHPGNASARIEEIPDLIRKAPIVPESRSIGAILQFMRNEKIHMVLVVDEYGQVSGLCTMEDILEEIVGNILDEFDAEDHYIETDPVNGIVIDGLTPIEQVEEVLHCNFHTDFETLNGYLTDRLGRIPDQNDTEVRGEHFLFHILEVENHVIKKVKAKRLQ
ncbi:MAG: HlyC/CorC family transporter [Lachnospiraceae bacterium]|nr:HlyC/CorC family transporter [Lachnospiraceae bacterium]